MFILPQILIVPRAAVRLSKRIACITSRCERESLRENSLERIARRAWRCAFRKISRRRNTLLPRLTGRHERSPAIDVAKARQPSEYLSRLPVCLIILHPTDVQYAYEWGFPASRTDRAFSLFALDAEQWNHGLIRVVDDRESAAMSCSRSIARFARRLFLRLAEFRRPE